MFGLGRKKSVKVVDRYVSALNARDSGRIAYLLAPDCRYVDSQGDYIEGREAIVDATERFFDLEQHYRLSPTSRVERDGEVLLRGSASADDPRLSTDTLWKARVQRGKITHWQSYGPPDAPHLARIIGGTDARHGR